MSEPVLIAVLALAGVVLTTGGAVGGYLIAARTAKRSAEVQAEATRVAAQAQAEAARVAAAAQAEANRSTSDNALIDQLQEELKRYREATDKRLDRLEDENRGYRAFIGVQRDQMAAHGVPLPAWPEGLPR